MTKTNAQKLLEAFQTFDSLVAVWYKNRYWYRTDLQIVLSREGDENEKR